MGLRAKRHSLGSFFSLHLWRMSLPSGGSTVTSYFLNTTVHFVSHMGPTPMSVLVNYGMMHPVVGKSAANCGICRVSFAADVATCTFSVPT